MVSTDSAVQVGTLSVDLAGGVARVDGVRLVLSRTEWKLLAYLAERSERMVASADLHRAVWGDPDGDNQTLRVWVHRLRTRGVPNLITFTGRGYGLISPAVRS